MSLEDSSTKVLQDQITENFHGTSDEMHLVDIPVQEFLHEGFSLCLGSLYVIRQASSIASFDELSSFPRALESQKGSETDPLFLVHSFFSCRPRGTNRKAGSQRLLEGSPVDPRSNVAHRLAVQYLSDFGVLSALTCYDGKVLVTAVGYISARQEALCVDMLVSTAVRSLVFIVMESGSRVALQNSTTPELNSGDLLVIPWRRDMGLPKFVNGSGVSVVVGVPLLPSKSRNRVCLTKTDARFEMTSLSFDCRSTFNRSIGDDSVLFESQIACPDCRRPLRIEKCESHEEKSLEGGETVFVTIACDDDEIRSVLDIGGRIKDMYLHRALVVTSLDLLTDEVKAVWPEYYFVSMLHRWRGKKELNDNAVPEGFIAPYVFPKTQPYKDTLYTTVQVLGIEALWGRKIWLMDPQEEDAVELVPTKTLYRQMMAELRDFYHPCHKERNSPFDFIHEWIDAYVKN